MVLVDKIIMAGRVYISVVDNSERSTFTVSDLYPSLRIGSNRQFGNQSSIEFVHLGGCSISGNEIQRM